MSQTMPGRTVLHVDMDAFFASVEQQRNPELRGRPVIVGGRGDPTQRGVVSAASYEARAYGVRSAMPLRTALRRCPQGVFLAVDMAAYEEVSDEIKTLLRGYTTQVEDRGLDEAFVELAHGVDVVAAVADIKGLIRDRTGLTCSIGVGPNKLMAKIASDMQKPDGVTFLDRAGWERSVTPGPVSMLWGVGPKTQAKLVELGVSTVGELAELPVSTLERRFGRVFGRHLYLAARGIDESPIVTEWERKSLSREITFQADVANPGALQSTVVDLAARVAELAATKGYSGRTVTVKVRFVDFVTLTRSKTIPDSTRDPDTISRLAIDCLGRVEMRRPVRLLGVQLSNLAHS